MSNSTENSDENPLAGLNNLGDLEEGDSIFDFDLDSDNEEVVDENLIDKNLQILTEAN